MKILLLHGYSATNAGDGLLVAESLELLRESFGDDAEITVIALYPETFDFDGVRVIDSRPTKRGYPAEFRKTLSAIDDFDLVVGVGGGYLRSGNLTETLKTLLVHGPQLRAAARRRGPVVYLPQSVGPFRLGTRSLFRRPLSRVDAIHLRDDRSVAELDVPVSVRTPDMALLSNNWRPRESDRSAQLDRPVVSVRHVRGKLSDDLTSLVQTLGSFDGYVQSTGGSNDDRAAVAETSPLRILERSELIAEGAPSRVVVAVRLHAALMALQAGHWVIHLAYERKGFGAFSDLGLPDYVYNVNAFDERAVARQVDELLHDAEARRRYDAAITGSRARLERARDSVKSHLIAATTRSGAPQQPSRKV
ncbi:polysaccharide pyruvyl transferase family protein [Agromyces atrinae]|uniref:polysaccharide pyruvyl transferase family protein n=1 Tax=Agromyces atrinae TaxID=592376 RepID=UPI0035562C2B